MPFCEQIIAEVISLKSGLGFPRENFIPIGNYNSLPPICKAPFFSSLPPAPVKRTPGPLAAFLRLFPLPVGLHCRRYLLRAKDPLDPCIAGGDLPQFPVLCLRRHQPVRLTGAAPMYPAIFPSSTSRPPVRQIISAPALSCSFAQTAPYHRVLCPHVIPQQKVNQKTKKPPC